MRLDEAKRIVARGESQTVEFKASTGELREAGESLCGFLNAQGGIVFIGVTPAGKIIGQQVSDRTQQEIAHMTTKIEPAIPVEMWFLDLPETERQLIVLMVD